MKKIIAFILILAVCACMSPTTKGDTKQSDNISFLGRCNDFKIYEVTNNAGTKFLVIVGDYKDKPVSIVKQ